METMLLLDIQTFPSPILRYRILITFILKKFNYIFNLKCESLSFYSFKFKVIVFLILEIHKIFFFALLQDVNQIENKRFTIFDIFTSII